MKPRHFLYAFLLFIFHTELVFAQKKLSVPNWKPGYTAYYLIRVKTARDIKAQSALSFPDSPNSAAIDLRAVLQVEIPHAKNAAPGGDILLHTHFLDFRSNPVQETPLAPSGEAKFVDCTLQRDGQIAQITGLDLLSPNQQTAWSEWAAQFSAAFLTQMKGRKRGDKWSSEEQETSPSPIAQLLWQKKSQYVHDEPCTLVKLDPNGEAQRTPTSDSCAVILTTASLIQKSSQQDATPADYKIRGLRTRGSAKGENEIFLYISRSTGQLVRAAQDAKQQMEVQIALADGTNQVLYAINASSNSSVELVSELTLNSPSRH